MITVYDGFVIIECDHPDCRRQVMADSGGGARSLAKTCGWKSRDRWGHIDDWWLCEEHKAYRPVEP